MAVERVGVEGEDAAEDGVDLGMVYGGCVCEAAVEGYIGVADVVDVAVIGVVAGREAGYGGVRWGFCILIVGKNYRAPSSWAFWNDSKEVLKGRVGLC